jgi:hypothetical protein
VGIERFRPTARVEIDGASRTLLGGNTTSGPKANYSTGTYLLDPDEGRPTPGQTVRSRAGYDGATELIGTHEIDASGVNLAPNELEIRCTGILSRTKERIGEPPSIVDGEAEQEYVAIWEGATASVIIAGILNMYGITAYSLEDDGHTYGNIEPVGLLTSDNGWALIEQMDEIEGYKTFDGPDGVVRRTPFAGIPSGVGRTLVEGVDIYTGKLDESRTGTYNRVIISGLPQIGSTGVDFVPTAQRDAPSPWIPSPPTYRAYTFSSALLETEEDCDRMAARKLGELNRLRGELPFELALGDATLRPGMSIAIDSEHLDVRTGVRFWVVEVVHDLGDGFNTSGTLLMASEGTGWSPNQAPIAIIDASAKAETLADDTEIVVVALDGSASYDPELGVLGIVSYSWAGDPVDPTPFDSAMRATAIYEDGIPDDAWIELTVTDDLGKTGKSRIYPAAQGLPVKQRDLISAELTRTQATRDGGATWNSTSPAVAGMVVTEFAAAEYALVADGDGDLYKVLADDSSVEVLAGEDITAASISLENGDPERKTGRTWAGDATGGVWRSYADGDMGTWELVGTIPGGLPINYIGESPFQEGDLEAASGPSSWRSFDAGANWSAQYTHPNAALTARRIASGFGKSWIGYSGPDGDDMGESRLQERDDAIDLDFPEDARPASILGLALDPFEDVIYVLDIDGDGNGRTWTGDSANGGLLAPGAAWDDAEWGEPRHMIRDGTASGYLYIAAEKALLKSVDGLQTILVLKELSGGAEGMMLGYGAERVLAIVATTVKNDLGVGKVLHLGTSPQTPPAAWYAIDYDDSAWTPDIALVSDISASYALVPGTGWTSYATGTVANSQLWLYRRTFTLPAGKVNEATLTINVDEASTESTELYLNGQRLGTPWPEIDAGSLPTPYRALTVDPALLRPGLENAIAIFVNSGAGPTAVSFVLEVN